MVESCSSVKKASPTTLGVQDVVFSFRLNSLLFESNPLLSLSDCSKIEPYPGEFRCSMVLLGRRTGPGCRGGATSWARRSIELEPIFIDSHTCCQLATQFMLNTE